MRYFLFLTIVLVSCSSNTQYKTNEVQLFELGEISSPDMQISGMDWYCARLVLLPQIPLKREENSILYFISKSNLNNHIKDTSTRLDIKEFLLIENGLENILHGIEWEGLAFYKDEAFLLIENDQSDMLGYIVKGQVVDSMKLIIDPSTLQQIPLPIQIDEMACEALVVTNGKVIVFYEANGANVNVSPKVFSYDLNLNFIGSEPIPNIEYRITDATKAEDGKVWVINTFWPGDEKKLMPADEEFLPVTTTSRSDGIKRLIELKYNGQSISVNNKNAIMLGPKAWNWEALARFDDQGFLIINDTYAPDSDKTWLGYIRINE